MRTLTTFFRYPPADAFGPQPSWGVQAITAKADEHPLRPRAIQLLRWRS